MSTIDKVQDARRNNLRELIARNNDASGRGGITVIAKRLGYDWPGFVSHLSHGRRVMTEATARAIEEAFSLPPGAMDVYPLPAEGAKPAPAPKPEPRTPAASADSNRLLVLLVDAANRAGIALPPEKIGPALALMQSGAGDAEQADMVVRLLG